MRLDLPENLDESASTISSSAWANQAQFGLNDHRIGFHQPMLADALATDEHALGIEMARHHTAKGREDHILLAIDGANRE
jgi:hypothetical protein